jgi:hypothetical protein
MSEEGIIDLLTFPDVPLDRRPQKIFIDYFLDGNTTEVLHGRGYEVIDVRSLANASDGDRAEAVKAHLQGIRQRTILPTEGAVRYIELEAKIYGLLDTKKRSNAPDTKLTDDLVNDLKTGFSSKYSQGKLGVVAPKRKRS